MNTTQNWMNVITRGYTYFALLRFERHFLFHDFFGLVTHPKHIKCYLMIHFDWNLHQLFAWKVKSDINIQFAWKTCWIPNLTDQKVNLDQPEGWNVFTTDIVTWQNDKMATSEIYDNQKCKLTCVLKVQNNIKDTNLESGSHLGLIQV